MLEDIKKMEDELRRRKEVLSAMPPGPVGKVEDPNPPTLVGAQMKDVQTTMPSTSEEPEPTGYGQTFLDLLRQNEEFMKAEVAKNERNEKARRARLAIASLSDGLSALGNLIGTTQGAFNQPQTYQTPIVGQQIDNERQHHSALIDRLRSDNESIRLAKAKLDAAEEQAINKAQRALELEEARFQHNMDLIESRGEQARMTEGEKHENRTTEEEQKQEGRMAVVGAKTESSERIAAGRNATSRANTQDRIAASNGHSGSSGKGKMTETGRAIQIQREAELAVNSELGPELIRRGVRLPYGWEKNWKRYVQSAPEFYDKYFRKKGWEDLGGTPGSVSSTEGKTGGFRTGGSGSGKKGGFVK